MQTMKLIAGDKKLLVKVEKKGNHLWMDFPFSRPLMAEIKVMEGARYHGFDAVNPLKQWSILDCPRNQFQLSRLKGENPYARWDKPMDSFDTKRPVYVHQKELFSHWMTVHYAIWASEMGTGKTLAAIEGIEYVQPPGVWWIGPKSALAAVRLEFRKWNACMTPTFYTYEQLVKILKDWTPGTRPPMMVVFDESSRCKTPTAQRSQAAKHLADSIRETWGDNGYVLLMSGSPAPKSPADWWMQCEIACPGYIREGTLAKFTERLAVVESSDSTTGGKYNRLVSWKDDANKCATCGQDKSNPDHTTSMEENALAHPFTPSKNEVEALYRRMKGLVYVKFKKDCLSLPDKVYRRVICKPKPSTLNAARLLTNTAPSVVVGMTWLRELSDGFQYKDVPKEMQHVSCGGNGCDLCNWTGHQHGEIREVVEVPCPKEEAIVDILDEHEDIGRLVVYAGFTGSIDRIERVCQKFQWETIRVDGRGWKMSCPMVDTAEDALLRFQDRKIDQRIVFIGHPGSAGMGITLTASPTIVYYSNDFNAESRIQSEDRIHRPGLDVNLGATIIDLIHLPTDIKVLDNLQKKRDLQSMTLGDMKEAMNLELPEESRA